MITKFKLMTLLGAFTLTLPIYATNPASTDYVNQKIAEVRAQILSSAYISRAAANDFNPTVPQSFNLTPGGVVTVILFPLSGVQSSGSSAPTYNASTGEFTIQKTGVYTVNYGNVLQVTSSAGAPGDTLGIQEYLMVNGSNPGRTNQQIIQPSFSGNVVYPGFYILSLNQGDIVSLGVNVSFTSDPGYTLTAGAIVQATIQIFQIA